MDSKVVGKGREGKGLEGKNGEGKRGAGDRDGGREKKRKERKIDFILVSNFRLFYKSNNISKELCFISPYKHKYILE